MRKILPYVFINGKIIDQKSALISAFDTGLQNGIGVFTTLKVREGYPLFLNHHLSRLRTNAHTVEIKKIPSDSELKKAVHSTIKKNKLTTGGIRLTLTPMSVEIHAFTTDTAIQKVSVITVTDTRDIYKTIKTTYRVTHLLAQKQAHEKDAQDALFTQDNKLIESTYANIFSIKNNQIITPPIEGKGFDGISRQILMANLPIQEKDIPADTTDPIILTSSLSTRVVENIDGRKIQQNSEFFNAILQAREKAEKDYLDEKK